ncbi:hypothetical protein OKW40_000422 [Paraburkholderia sp. RAU6.4a]|uniref:hypothetical protein n=1 Tax=Paraburkholderia sp. RAU6.4a TaxID=2991067 RepID=UPI003D246E3D
MIYVVEQSDLGPLSARFAHDDFEREVAASDPLSLAEINDEVTPRELLALSTTFPMRTDGQSTCRSVRWDYAKAPRMRRALTAYLAVREPLGPDALLEARANAIARVLLHTERQGRQ